MLYWGKNGASLEALAAPAIVLLVGVSAFGLGRLSVEAGQGVVQARQPQSAAEPVYIASKNGTKYYLPTCAGAERIEEGNEVWFATAKEAAKAGYEPAANCPGI